MEWNEIVEKITPYVVKIETPGGHGTGFLCLYNADRSFCGIATASHVVSYADRWQQPIRIFHFPSSGVALLSESARTIWTDPGTDSAVILLQTGQLDLPENPIPLLPSDSQLAIGAEVGWLGFPAIAAYTLCFFSGNISARQEDRHAYLIDGVAINGVSGGPVVYSTATEGVQIVGTITAYRPSRTTSATLPGLSFAQDVSHFHLTISSIKSIDEANQRKLQQQQQPGMEVAEESQGPPKGEPPTA
jgi:hypothetical protein